MDLLRPCTFRERRELPRRSGSAVRRRRLGEREPAEEHLVAVLDAVRARERDGGDGESATADGEEDDKFAAVDLDAPSEHLASKVAAAPLPLLATQRLLERDQRHLERLP